MKSIDSVFTALPASAEALRAAERDIGKILPNDYKSFLLEHNGGEGLVGEHYLILWSAEELFAFNEGYEVSKYASGLLMFGSTGGGDGFAFDTRTSPYRVMQVPFVGMSVAEKFLVAGSFTELLDAMQETEVPSSQLPKKNGNGPGRRSSRSRPSCWEATRPIRKTRRSSRAISTWRWSAFGTMW